MRKTHKNGYMSYVECRMLPINAMVLVCISQLHFTQATHQSRLVCKQKYPISMLSPDLSFRKSKITESAGLRCIPLGALLS